MPAYLSGQDIMDEHQLIEEVLDKFVNGHEQTYEEFLSTFTHLSKEDHETKRRVYGNDSSENILTSIKFANGDKPDDHHLENKTISLPTSLQCSEEEQVDNFLDLEDLDLDEELKLKMNSDFLLLPGEVEQDLSVSIPSYIPSMVQSSAPAVKLKSTKKGTNIQTEEILGDEVQPFSLDEEFDYDNVILTPKFTAAEIDAIKELSKQKKTASTDLDLEAPHD
ncbi:intraflagellar transport-associated protein isoform X3 [Erinaceus europaeus]|uniref:Intraflagellar transport-associated protein isoform X3 n=1 Tax=Erinaceus europaeus TaxID=9365 RepID=A0ABM3W7K1_ERIEU|nr:intraflagellar transport-associated protein isoform X3 [Erinaceus europaeus]